MSLATTPTQQNTPRWQPALLLSGWLAILALAVVWRLQNIDAFGLNNDEGAYLMWARLIAEGFPLYTATHTGSPPLFLEALAGIFQLFGFSALTGRLFVLACYLVLCALLSYLSGRIAGWAGAYTALIIALFITPMFSLSRQVMLEIPAMTLAVAGVCCGYLYWQAAQRQAYRPTLLWLALSGAFVALSVMVKFLHPLAMIPLLWFVWNASAGMANRAKHVFILGLAFLIALFLVLIFTDINGFIDQAIQARAQTQVDEPLQFQSNWQGFVSLATSLWGLFLLALAGAIFRFKKVTAQAWLIWFIANFALVMWYRPIFPHHYTILLAPTILLAVEYIAFLTSTLTLPRNTGEGTLSPGGEHEAVSSSGLERGLAWGLILVALLNIPALVQANQKITAITTGGREAEAAQILAQVTRPDDFVISDSQLLALWANRRTPPPLVDVSLVFIQSGRLTADNLIALSEKYQISAVAPWTLRLIWLPQYLAWAEDNFWVHKVWDDQHSLYFGPKHPPNAPIPNAQSHQFEGGINLLGHKVEANPVSPAETLPLTLYWQTDQPQNTDYTIFVQLLNEAGTLVAQTDSQPIYGYFPLSQWPVNEVIADRMTLDLPADIPPGLYTLIAGMYDPQTVTRLNLLENGQDYVVLDAVEIAE